MQVKMKDGLPSTAAVVEDHAVAVGDLLLAGDLCGDEQQLPEDALVGGIGIVQRSEVFSRTDQDVRGRVRMAVLEGENFAILVDEFCGLLFASDLAEGAVLDMVGPPGRNDYRAATRCCNYWLSSRTTSGSAIPSFWRSVSLNCLASSSPEMRPTRTR